MSGPLDAPARREAVDAVILGAMDEEVAPFLAAAAASGAVPEPHDVGRARLWRLAIEGRDVLLVRSGIGTVNAAAATVIALHEVAPAVILSTGSAGGLGGTCHVGDVVVGASCTYSAADARAFGYALGQVPGMPVDYPGDAGLLARAAGADLGDIIESAAVVTGQVVSGDVFVDGERLPPLRAAFPDAAATDMESAAIAQVAFSFGVPFLTARGISDLCGPDAGTEHPQTVDAVSAVAARTILTALG